MGLDSESVGSRLGVLLEGVDASLFIRLRRFWPDLAVAGIAASGSAGVLQLTDDFIAAAEAISTRDPAPPEQLDALHDGLRASWIQALGVALAVAMSADARDAFAASHPRLVDSDALTPVETQTVTGYADSIRARGLVPQAFVSVPLSEFTDWAEPLIGETVFASFVAWARSNRSNAHQTLLRKLERSVRFIPLHEACLAVHLWAAPGSDSWLDEALGIMRRQPLVKAEHLTELYEAANSIVDESEPQFPESLDAKRPLYLRVGMPSLPVRSDQLDVILKHDLFTHADIIEESRKSTQIVVRAAAKRKVDVLALPEWAVLPELLGWLMDQSRRAGMLIVAGQAPTVAGGQYSNVVWTGLPLTDPGGRRACLVPPPREKRYLSPHEEVPLTREGVGHSPGGEVPVYRWRGLGVASLICFEFADVSTRHRLRAKTDLLIVSSLNKDWRYFEAIQDSTTRDNYCITFCVNTSEFPGTRITRPTRNEMAVVASVHGAGYPAVVTRQLDFLPVVAARARKKAPKHALTDIPRDGVALADYKPIPPVW